MFLQLAALLQYVFISACTADIGGGGAALYINQVLWHCTVHITSFLIGEQTDDLNGSSSPLSNQTRAGSYPVFV